MHLVSRHSPLIEDAMACRLLGLLSQLAERDVQRAQAKEEKEQAKLAMVSLRTLLMRL